MLGLITMYRPGYKMLLKNILWNDSPQMVGGGGKLCLYKTCGLVMD